VLFYGHKLNHGELLLAAIIGHNIPISPPSDDLSLSLKLQG
jgi:hypothetical protein